MWHLQVSQVHRCMADTQWYGVTGSQTIAYACVCNNKGQRCMYGNASGSERVNQ